jgi:hypothetical protein
VFHVANADGSGLVHECGQIRDILPGFGRPPMRKLPDWPSQRRVPQRQVARPFSRMQAATCTLQTALQAGLDAVHGDTAA